MINPYGGSYTAMAPNYGGVVYPYATSSQNQSPNVVYMALVNSEDEARNYPLSPGSSMFLMDSNNQVFYTKSVDFSGISTFKKYQFNEITDAPAEVPANNYITKEEFEEFKASLNRNNKSYRKERNGESSSQHV